MQGLYPLIIENRSSSKHLSKYVLFAIAARLKHPNCPPANQWVKELWNVLIVK